MNVVSPFDNWGRYSSARRALLMIVINIFIIGNSYGNNNYSNNDSKNIGNYNW